jgi:hypothetical protein
MPYFPALKARRAQVLAILTRPLRLVAVLFVQSLTEKQASLKSETLGGVRSSFRHRCQFHQRLSAANGD